MKKFKLRLFLTSLFFTCTSVGQSTYEARHDEYYDYLSERKINLGQIEGPHRAGRTGFWTTQGRLQRGMAASNPNKVWGELKSVLKNADGEQDANGANGGFSAWPGMDTYMRWNHLMPKDVKDAYQEEYLGMVTYGRGSTPNQRMMWAAACRLACETWGTNLVTSNSNASNKTGDVTGKKYIEAVCERTVKYNFDERWAKHYLQYTLGPLRSVADFTNDSVLANKARMTWNWGWMDIASLTFKGRWAIPAGRGSLVQDGNSCDISEYGSWLMFGGSPRSNLLDADQSLLYSQPKTGTPNTVTQPPIIPEMLEAATNRDVPYTRRGLARLHETQYATSYLTKDWVLYSQLEGDTSLNADGTIKIKDFNNGGVPSNDWNSERWAIMWDETNTAGLTIKAPTGYGWSQGTGISPYEDVVQHEGALVGIINIPATSKWPYTRDYIPTNTTAVINEAATSGRLFLHYSKVLVAITRSDVGNFTWPPDSQTSCLKRGFAIECASVSEYSQDTPEERLAAFRADIIANEPDMSHVNDATPRMIYTTRTGKVLEITYGQGGIIDGSPVDYEGWPLNESPWSYQLQMGNMWVFGKNRKLLWNYKNWTESEDNIPTVITNSAVSALGTSAVEVDLSKRFVDKETSSADLNYRVTGASNGKAYLLGDGKTVRFLPAANFSGESKIDVTAGGPFPDHRFIVHYDNEGTTIGSDSSTNERHAPPIVGGIATANHVMETPSAISDASNNQSLRLRSSDFGSAKLSRLITPATLNFSNHDWTFATWFKRESFADDDFLFYVGSGDGFGGDGQELQVWLPSQSKTVAVRHYNDSNALTFSLSTGAKIDTNTWHHVAVQFSRVSHNSGVVKLFLDGEWIGTSKIITWALKQNSPVYFGGPAANTVLTRGFDGLLDDTILARGALTDDEILQLSTASASHLGGMKLKHTISVSSIALPPNDLSALASNNAVSLTWKDVSGAMSYNVKRSSASAGPFTTIASGLKANSFVDDNAEFGTTYFYVVTVTNNSGESLNSNIVNCALPASDVSIWNNNTMREWKFGARIAFPSYLSTEKLNNFPMLVRFDSNNIPGFSYEQVAFSNASDLRFTDANGLELSYEIDTWNPSGTSYVWVNVTEITKGGSIIAYWGNSNASATALPDSMSGLLMWLRADSLSLEDGAKVTSWTDASTNARHAELTQGSPTFETNELNGKPVVRFSSNGESSFTFPSMNNIRTVFWVVKEDTTGQHFLLGDDNTFHFHRGSTGTVWDSNHTHVNIRTGTTKINGESINGTSTPLGAGWKLISVVTEGNVESSRLSRDRTIGGRSWDGDVAEVIVYNRALTSQEEHLIGAYLAQKYALASRYTGMKPTYTSNGSAWSGGFSGVWHLNGATVNDSTSTPINSTTNATITNGVIGNALQHDGTSQHTIIANAPDVNVLNHFELSGWFKMAPNDKINWRTLWAKESSSNERNWWISVNGNGQIWWKSSAGTDITSKMNYADNQWHYVAAVNDGNYSRLYVDAVLVGQDTAANEDQTSWSVRIGSQNSTRWWKGSLDEFRIAKVKRSAEWVRATYDNISSASWSRTGRVVANAASFNPMISTRVATDIEISAARLNGYLASTGASTTNVIIYYGEFDGGADPTAWTSSLDLGTVNVGNFSVDITGLTSSSKYYYRAFARNATSTTWAAETISFITNSEAPTGLSATPTSGLVKLHWNNSPRAISYHLKRSTTENGPYTSLLSNIISPSASDSTVKTDVTYYYVVSAVDSAGETANSSPIMVSTLSAPENLTATAGDAKVGLTWSAVSGATSYSVQRSTTMTGAFSVIANNVTSSNYIDATALNGTQYFYFVTAKNSNFESNESSAASAVPSANIAAPTNFTGIPDSKSVRLSWDAVQGATHYRVKRSITSQGPYTIVSNSVYAPSFNNTGLDNGTTYYYVVSAMNGSIESFNSSQLSITPNPRPSTFTTSSSGLWTTATWAPQKPFSGNSTSIVLNNTSAMISSGNLGTIIANKIQLANAAVTLSGDQIYLLGISPSIITNANAAHSISNKITLDGDVTINIASNETILSGMLNGSGSLSKIGNGKLILNSNNIHTGNTAVKSGILNLRNANSLGYGEIHVASGASLELEGGIKMSATLATLVGSGNINGVLRSVRGNNEWPGDITLVPVNGVSRIGCDSGILTLSGEINLPNSNDQLVVQGNGATIISGSITGPCRFTRSVSGTGIVSLVGDNTYTGQTSLNGGITEVGSISSITGDLGDEEVALNSSGLGAPTSVGNGTIAMGNAATTATLRYIGPTLKTDRVFAMAGTTGGATIEHNGSGTLTLLSSFTAPGVGSKTLTLSGISDGVINGAIVDNSDLNKTFVVKSGSGSWTLAGSNTYTGTTNIDGGKLLISGSFTSNINVKDGIFAPRSTPITNGDIHLSKSATWETRAALDSLTSSGSITLAGNLSILAEEGIADGETFTILNKTSAGAVNGIFDGKPQGSIFTASGYKWTISYTGGDGNDITLTAHSLKPIEQWRLTHYGTIINDNFADSDNDGENNLLEYATAQDPHSKTRAITPAVINKQMLETSYVKNKSATDLAYVIEWSDNLKDWSSEGINQVILTDGSESQTIKVSVSLGTNRRFIRLRVSVP